MTQRHEYVRIKVHTPPSLLEPRLESKLARVLQNKWPKTHWCILPVREVNAPRGRQFELKSRLVEKKQRVVVLASRRRPEVFV